MPNVKELDQELCEEAKILCDILDARLMCCPVEGSTTNRHVYWIGSPEDMSAGLREWTITKEYKSIEDLNRAIKSISRCLIILKPE